MNLWKKFEVLFLIFIFIINFEVTITFGKVNQLNDSKVNSEYEIFKNIDSKFKDFSNGGYYDKIDDYRNVISSSKVISDYISAVNTIVNFVKYTNNNSYLMLVPKYLDLINKFNNSNVGFKSVENSDWSDTTGSWLESITFSQLISMYANLFRVTNDTSYLGTAFYLYNFLQTHFYDSIHGGYYLWLDPNTLNYLSGYERYSTYYGTIAQAFLDLYMVTNNQTILTKGYDLLNSTINIAYDYNHKYFIPFLYADTNQPDSSFTSFSAPQQLNMAIILLKYANLSVIPEYNNQKQEFINISLSIYNNIKLKLLVSQTMVKQIYDVNSNSIVDTIDCTTQAQFYNYLLELQDYNISFSGNDQLILNKSSSILSTFIGLKSGLFLRSSDNQVTQPWVNYVIIDSLLNLLSHSYSVLITFPKDSSNRTSSILPTTSTVPLATNLSIQPSTISTTPFYGLGFILSFFIVSLIEIVSRKKVKKI